MNQSASSPIQVELQWASGVIELKELPDDAPPPRILVVARHPAKPEQGNARFVQLPRGLGDARVVYREEA
jgi:hypothetical protein